MIIEPNTKPTQSNLQLEYISVDYNSLKVLNPGESYESVQFVVEGKRRQPNGLLSKRRTRVRLSLYRCQLASLTEFLNLRY